MRYLATAKLEIIRIVEQLHLSAKRTRERLDIPRMTLNRWHDRYISCGLDALEDRKSMLGHFWNRIPDDMRQGIVNFALEEPELTPRELAVRFTDTKKCFVSESPVYGILKALGLITSPAFVVIKAAPLGGASLA